MDEWRQIGDSHYSVSPDGRVRNDETRKLKTPVETKDGYLRTDLYNGNGKRVTKRINRLVAEAYIPNPDNKPQVNHIDGNKKNNDVNNLEWSTGSENMQHAFRTGLATYHNTHSMLGKKNPNAGAKGHPIICVETGYYYKNIAEAERQTGIPDSCICDCLKGRCSHAHHKHFVYA